MSAEDDIEFTPPLPCERWRQKPEKSVHEIGTNCKDATLEVSRFLIMIHFVILDPALSI